jgi:hypothetical protein
MGRWRYELWKNFNEKVEIRKKKGKSFGRDVEMGEKNNLDGC